MALARRFQSSSLSPEASNNGGYCVAYALQQLINGVSLGMIYGLIAVGYTMVYGIIGMINFAHGDVFMVGAFVSLITALLLGLGGGAAGPGALLLVLLAGMSVTALYGWTVEFSYVQMLIIVVTLAVLAGFTLLVTRTPMGRAMRACEQDRKMAALLGIDTDRIISLTFVIGAALAAVAGCMYLLRYGVIDYYIGFLAGVKAFTAAVLGGIGSLPGAVLGGLLIGLIETFWSAYFSAQYKDVAAFSILILTLVLMPSGLLGRQEVEKV